MTTIVQESMCGTIATWLQLREHILQNYYVKVRKGSAHTITSLCSKLFWILQFSGFWNCVDTEERERKRLCQREISHMTPRVQSAHRKQYLSTSYRVLAANSLRLPR